MSNQTLPPPINDPYQYLKVQHNPNDTLTRNLEDPHTSPSLDTSLSVLTKDLTINQSNQTWLRLFLPKKATNVSNLNNKLLPLIVFFHGSGFIVLSAASTMFHNFCAEMAETVEAVVASVDYRLAPEHRLPAAYDDAMEALSLIRSSDDEWLTKYVDFSKCFLMGNSAGGTIAYHAGLRVVEKMNDLEPLKIQGLILRQPFFGGTNRTESELRLENDPVFPLCVSDLMWELALPIGVNRDHEYSNLRVGNGVDEKLAKIKDHEWRVLVSMNGGDPLVDRNKELVKLLEEKGVEVVKDFQEDGFHGVEFFELSKAKNFIEVVKGFIS
ncbi:putative carboxylesterase [Medicago truncatula]|uniref:Gibberellin receptor GID1, putative n=1 Tax=Medicago truncatula TaxID=3880 RepID=A0A072UAU3_MEDTR|nr:probable carboxylesterase 120 [Medicago truncatula]KEH26541.1 gibberellin receptor GID1, putative [Medicago truncatula]RHN51918.1 putative carboxylesterase [Medicago truncatula]